MKLLVFSAKEFEKPFLYKANQDRITMHFTEMSLDTRTAQKAVGYDAISIFSGDDASQLVLEKLHDLGVKYIAIRSAGYNNIHLKAAKRIGLKVANVPDYSPHAIAEHATAILLALVRKIVRADRQLHQDYFLLDDLMGFNLHGKTIGILGTGRIGTVMAKIMKGFGCEVLATDPLPDNNMVELGLVKYVEINDLFTASDVISIHIPLTYENYYFIDEEKLSWMKPSAILVNTARGAVVQTNALIEALEKGQIAGYATDVYEKERGLFFRDHSGNGISDERFKKLRNLPNVLITPHQAFVTQEAIENIAEMTIENLWAWDQNLPCKNELGIETMMS
ncbi:2-hydroxyacid dehydrogenase [Zeaxanthinibacter sp. PT1]|uniref:2-hydroxyacid dehydrogenase n=1 Tax=Zeaxanthinibacter TaxID=561554 RepID=UPI002349BF65|nr:2-hydroxyacid dehydrogenase [Zeaxanthinibacter sp. PT1]MDC6351939.1 2-hydroxyacid dehydrogenase [Zeaxanthinibacter sp. PT1]